MIPTHLFGGAHQGGNRSADLPCEELRQPSGHKKHEQRDQDNHLHVIPAHTAALFGQLLEVLDV